MQELFIGQAPDIPEPLHPTSIADITRGLAFLSDLNKSVLFAAMYAIVDSERSYRSTISY